MATRRIIRDGKNSSIMQTYDNFNFPLIIPGELVTALNNIKALPCRHDDVLVVTYPKSGTHLVYNIVKMLRNGNSNLNKEQPIFLDYEEMDKIAMMKSPRVLLSHLPFKYLPQDLTHGKGKVIVVYRNPKDVCISLYTFLKGMGRLDPYRGDWDGFVNFFLQGHLIHGSWFGWMKRWESKEIADMKNVYFVRYEDLVTNPGENIRKIANFIEEYPSQTVLDDIVKSIKFSNMKAHFSKDENQYTFFSERNASTPNLYRKGEIGDWRNWFTVAQSEKHDSVYEAEMRNSRFKSVFVKSQL